mmetsp:Transcript_1609/g.3522  ORF Transcript_1609/g.3522 Transcript_1609/m.3522 type:complete len:293 (-) Transcript_1609:704-1582(-)
MRSKESKDQKRKKRRRQRAMVPQVESDNCITKPAQLTASSSQSSSSSDDENDDIEVGYNSSQEDNNNKHHNNNNNNILSKFIPTEAGRMARRRSQCEQLSFRQRSSVFSKIHNNDDHQQSVPVLPKNIQFDPFLISNNAEEENSSSSSSSHSKQYHHLSPALFLLLFISIISISSIFIIIIYHQQTELNSLRQELQITNQHRLVMEHAQNTLRTQLHDREASLTRYRHTHERMSKLNRDMSVSFSKLQQDYVSTAKELERLRVVEKRLVWSERRLEDYVGGSAGDTGGAVTN